MSIQTPHGHHIYTTYILHYVFHIAQHIDKGTVLFFPPFVQMHVTVKWITHVRQQDELINKGNTIATTSPGRTLTPNWLLFGSKWKQPEPKIHLKKNKSNSPWTLFCWNIVVPCFGCAFPVASHFIRRAKTWFVRQDQFLLAATQQNTCAEQKKTKKNGTKHHSRISPVWTLKDKLVIIRQILLGTSELSISL